MADAIKYGTESFEGKEILDNLIIKGPKKLVKNWSNIDTWPGRLPFPAIEIIPGRLPRSGCSPLSHENDYLGAYHVMGACSGYYDM